MRVLGIGLFNLGVAFTYVGLVMFLTGVNVGFMPVGYKLGFSLAKLHPMALTGIGLAMGILVVLAEPAIHVLNQQVEEMGMAKRAQGIAFSLPVSDVAGLVQPEQLPEETEE